MLLSALLLVLACEEEQPGDYALVPLRTGDPDTTEITSEIRAGGGLVWITLTGWSNEQVIAELEAAGLGPPPGCDGPCTLPGLPSNVVAGRIPANGLDTVAALPYILKIEPAEPPVRNRERFRNR